MFQSNGVLTKAPDQLVWSGSLRDWPNTLPINGAWSSYSAIYRGQLWVTVLVNKIANATARLPLKVYEVKDGGRSSASTSPYGRLLAAPSTIIDPFSFWLWTTSTLNIHGEAFWGKVRDAGGRPVELVPLHPNYIHSESVKGRIVWRYESTDHKYDIDRRDLVHFKLFNPDSVFRGMSPLEPLRSTLENEDGARRANSALWRNGGRPSVYLQHPGQFKNDAVSQRLALQWSQIHSGVDNWAKAAILEEGMTANVMPLNVEELQYIEARKLNREEVCAAYDVPPPVVHILDRATFSNITEQMRSMYRDTMAPKLALLESTLEFELRDGRFGANTEPDFSENEYAEFLMDGVLRGSFEARTGAYQAAIQSGWMTPAEVRELENLPFIEGSDQLMANAALQPMQTELEPPAQLALPAGPVRSTLGRLGRCKSLDELPAVDNHDLQTLINGWKSSGTPMETVRAYLAAMLRNEDT